MERKEDLGLLSFLGGQAAAKRANAPTSHDMNSSATIFSIYWSSIDDFICRNVSMVRILKTLDSKLKTGNCE